MAKRKSPKKSSGLQEKWDEVFNALVKLSKNLKKERQFLEDKVNSLHEVISTMKMEQEFQSVMAKLFLGSREKDAFNYKLRCEDAYRQLADIGESFDYLSQRCGEPTNSQDITDDVSKKGESSRDKALQNEVRKLKSEIEKCKMDKNTEISALLSEKNFVWNQFKKMESDLNKEIRKKDDEVKYANEKLRIILDRADELQVSNEKLRTDFAKIESKLSQKSEENFRLSKEIELLKSGTGSATPLLRPCRGGNSSSTSNGGVIKVKKESDSSQMFGKMARTKPSAHKSSGGKAPRKQFITKEGSSSGGSKRKAVEVINITESPKLFNSFFKVPKLKPSDMSKKIV